MRYESGLNTLASILARSLHHTDLETKLKEQTCILVWDEVVGDQVSGAAQPEFVRDGCMFVITKTPVWANELTFYKRDMISRLNKKVGGQVLKDIVFRAGRIPRKRRNAPTKIGDRPNLEGIRLSHDELENLEATARGAGEGMYEPMKKLLITAAKLEKWKRSQGWTPCTKCGVLQHSGTGLCPVCGISK